MIRGAARPMVVTRLWRDFMLVALVVMGCCATSALSAQTVTEGFSPALSRVASQALPEGNGATVAAIQARGKVQCGTNTISGFALPNETGQWSGMMVDLCRALAAAVLSDSHKIEIVSVESKSRFKALSTHQIDVLLDGATWTLERDVAMGLSFPATWLYDGQAFLTRPSLGVHTAKALGNHSVCVTDGTTSRRNLEDYLRRTGQVPPVIIAQTDEGAWNSFIKGRCDVLTNDRFGLLTRARQYSGEWKDFVLLPELISKEPLGPVVREEDQKWFKLVRWVIMAMVDAEELGVTSSNINHLQADDVQTLILTGKGEDYGPALGIAPGWARRVIEQVGNYGEVFDRDLGSLSPFLSGRGVNALWDREGILYAPPL